jgi:fumarylpyruvate hydrolase
MTLVGRANSQLEKVAIVEAKRLFEVDPVLVPIIGRAEVFQIRRVYCVARNYAEHAREMGSDPTTEPPFYFQKPTDAVQVVVPGTVGEHPYPSLTENFHHEIELVAFLKSGGRDIPAERALACVYGYAVGLDMTRRDLQRRLADQKKPWELGKAFDQSAPLGHIHPVDDVGHPSAGSISLSVNGAIRQSSDLAEMSWSVAEQISQLSSAYELKAGDIIFSGTPENVGPVVRGDVLLGKIAGLNDLSIRIV